MPKLLGYREVVHGTGALPSFVQKAQEVSLMGINNYEHPERLSREYSPYVMYASAAAPLGQLSDFSDFGIEPPIVAPCIDNENCPGGYVCVGGNCEPAEVPVPPGEVPPPAKAVFGIPSWAVGFAGGLVIALAGVYLWRLGR